MSFDEFDPLSSTTKNAHLHPVPARTGVEIASVSWEFQPVPPSSARGRLSFSGDLPDKPFPRPSPSSSSSSSQQAAAVAQTPTERRRNNRTNATPTHKKTLSNTLKDASATLSAKQAKSPPASSTSTSSSSSSSSQTSVTVSAKGGAVIITSPPKNQQQRKHHEDDDEEEDEDDDDDDDDEEDDDDDDDEDEDDEDEDDEKSKPPSKSSADSSKTRGAGAGVGGSGSSSSAALSKQCAVAGCAAKRTTRGYCAQHAANPTAPVNIKSMSLTDNKITDRHPDQWSFNQIHSSTSLGLNKNCVEWIVVDKGVSHKIELFHSTIGGKRIIKINGATKLNEKRPMESGSRYDIRIGPKGQTTIGIEVRPAGLVGFSYELFVNGRTFEDAKRYWLRHNDA